MHNFHMYMCDSCGRSHEKPGVCLFCQAPLTAYTKETEIQHEYQPVAAQEPRAVVHEYNWYSYS